MKFYAIAYKFEEDMYVDFEKKDDTFSLSETCLLPTKELALQYIDDELGTNYVPVEIELRALSANGIASWSRGRVEEWDKEFD